MSRSPVPVAVRADARDRGLRRVRGVTGWVTAVATLGCIGLGGGYAVALPGVAYSRAASGDPGRASSGSASSVPAAPQRPRYRPSGAGHTHPKARRTQSLQPPAQPPAPSQAPPVTSSGGS